MSKTCKMCNKSIQTEIEYGLHMFIEHSISQQTYYLNSFIDHITLNDCEYKLAGIVNSYGGTSVSLVGHYTAFIKCNENWTQFHNLSRKPSRVKSNARVNPH